MNKQLLITAIVMLALGAGADTGWRIGNKVMSSRQFIKQKRTVIVLSQSDESIGDLPVPAKDAMGMDYVPVYADDYKDVGGRATHGAVARIINLNNQICLRNSMNPQ